MNKTVQLKRMIVLLMILVLVLMVLLFYNYLQILTYKSIIGGTYYTKEQCAQMFSF